MKFLLLLSLTLFAQDQTPVTFRADVVAKSTKAVNYRHRMGSTLVDIKGRATMPQAIGKAKVESKTGRIEIDFEIRNLAAASKFGSEYLTYVLWAITPEGRPRNLGEVQLLNGKANLIVTTELQAFGLVVTAEPYFAVTMPSDVVVAENEIRQDTQGRVETIDAKYELLQRGEYAKMANPIGLTIDPKVPLELYQARNALLIARSFKAEKYAPDVMAKAESSLKQAEAYQLGKRGAKPTAMMARDAVQRAEDARAVSVKRAEEERLDAERTGAAARVAKANQSSEAEARMRAIAESQLKLEEARRLAAEEAARKAMEKSNALTSKVELEKVVLRGRLLVQFNQILETRDSDRGLVLNLGDPMFDIGKATLLAEAREKLARLSGLVLAYPGLKLEAEGHSDGSASDSMNQRLSEQRAEAVRSFLESQRIPSGNLTAQGFGKSVPIADNETAKGRQLNRRVEIIISGEAIGTSSLP